MNRKRELQTFFILLAGFLACFYLPVESPRFQQALGESLRLVRWYAREHVLLCLVPAFFIAGAISVFIRKEAVLKFLGPKAPKPLAYGVASVSGTILAVCSCTVLPLFAGIWRMGAGLGPAVAFLYSGPAINVLAIVLTARVLGLEIGAARAAGAILFSVLAGLLMRLIFRREEAARQEALETPQTEGPPPRPLWQTAVCFGSMTAILVFANWGRPADSAGLWGWIWAYKWRITALSGLLLAGSLAAWYGANKRAVAAATLATATAALLAPGTPEIAFAVGAAGLALVAATGGGELGEWLEASWTFAKQILPLLFLGVLAAGFLLGRPGQEGIIPSTWVERAVGGNGLGATLFASVAGALMYFATLTEVPILQGLLGAGMGKGPALALLLAGPALSLPNMLVLRSVMGTKKTAVYVLLVVVMATIAGLIYGALCG